jgi:hypothetical protein
MFSNLDKAALIEATVVYSILSYAQMRYPREAILLLKGKGDKHKIVVNDTQIPPLAIHGNTFPISRQEGYIWLLQLPEPFLLH